ncbi:CHAP domain-containing protein [Snodgrassella sp. M0351]|uniref:CHAP domain-containing protein n=1 Tax=Snodgrassella sp. M0351 TaxID=2751012 RepID=UPI0018DC68BD|nr:phage tail tip lysozyme [Snodgrassella sp. M0351]MBI0164805.1 CHAP domain-containing protein [Snodgrassella sp. M0351]
MTTNIVEQMLVELMLDTSKFAAQADKAEKKNQALEKSLDKTEKASKQAGKANEELAKKYHSSIEQTAKFGQAIAKVTKELTGFFAVIIGSTGLFKLANDAAHANMEVSKLSGQLGMATASITDWQNAAGAFGGSAQGMTASLTGIKQAMNGLVMFGDASMLPYFNALGVSVVDDAGKVRKLDDVMLDLADSFQKMPKEQAYTIGKKMGFDDGTINALISGRKELQEILNIQKRMYHSDGEAIARSRELTKQQAILSAHWQSMKQLVGDALTPILLTLIKVVNSFFEFLQRHEKVIKAVFQTAAIVIGMLLIPTLLSAGRALLAFIAPFTPLIRLMGALGIAINPVIAAVTALAGAFVLLYDDYDTWAKGGKSLFDWSSFSAGIKDSKMSVDTLCTAFGNLVDAVKNNTIPTLKGYAEILGKLVRGDFTGAAKQAKQMIDNYSDIATGIIADAMGEKKEDVAGFIGESMYRLFHGGKDYFEQNGIQKPVEANAPAKAKKTAETAQAAADYATSHALKASAEKCAEYVNNALRAQGIKIWGHGRDVAGNLLKTGKFQSIAYNENYTPQKGDVMSMPSSSKSKHNYGHAAIFNGKYWVSDFIQTNKRGNTAAPSDAYFNDIRSGKITPVIARMKSSETPNQKKTATSVSVKGNMNYAQQIYASLREHGLSAQQARIMTAEIGRENSFNPDFLFGSHTDPKNGATNVGLISWQGIRAKKLIAELTAKGLYKNGKITRSKASLDEMVKYMLSEISNNPAYSKTKKEFLDNPNVAYDKGHKILGDNYIIWRQDDPKYKSGHDRRDAFFKQTANMEMAYNANRISKGVSQSNQLAGGNTTTHTDNRKYVNVNIPNMNVKTSSNTVSGNTVAAMKETHNYLFNQLGVSMT